MARDMVNARALEAKYRKDNTTQYNVRFTETSGIPSAMKRVNDAGIPTKTYIREALIEKLQRDGYLKAGEQG